MDGHLIFLYWTFKWLVMDILMSVMNISMSGDGLLNVHSRTSECLMMDILYVYREHLNHFRKYLGIGFLSIMDCFFDETVSNNNPKKKPWIPQIKSFIREVRGLIRAYFPKRTLPMKDFSFILLWSIPLWRCSNKRMRIIILMNNAIDI
jgi:hypothetical protein